jgi:hypothetical protein
MKLRIALNGTDKNPFEIWGLRCNPFPQLAKAEYDSATMRLQELGGEPIPNVEYIRKHLKGYFTDEFIEYCCRQFEPGKMVKFMIEFNE